MLVTLTLFLSTLAIGGVGTNWGCPLVPVRANITTNEQTHATGSNVQIRCDVYGYPPPEVNWYKDGVPLYSGGKVSISGRFSGVKLSIAYF